MLPADHTPSPETPAPESVAAEMRAATERLRDSAWMITAEPATLDLTRFEDRAGASAE